MDRNDYLSVVIVSHGSTVVIDKSTEGIRIYSQKRRGEFKRNGKCSSSSLLYCSCFFTAIFCWKEAESVLAVVGGKEKLFNLAASLKKTDQTPLSESFASHLK